MNLPESLRMGHSPGLWDLGLSGLEGSPGGRGYTGRPWQTGPWDSEKSCSLSRSAQLMGGPAG